MIPEDARPPQPAGAEGPLPPGHVRVTRPWGARPIIPERDLLSGPTTLHERHRRARARLLALLWEEPAVRAWRTRRAAALAPPRERFTHGFCAMLRRIRLDARGRARGLPVEAPATSETA